jgi:hypothetical protein
MKRLLHPESTIVLFLGIERFRWYRKWIGGHWEFWYIDFPVTAEIWFHLPECSTATKNRPSSLARGGPICEDYVAQSNA